MDKWICKICGNEIYEKPYKNQVCKLDGCKGRFIKYTQCKCGKWYYNKNDKKYCSSECSGRKPIVERKGKIKLTCTNCKKEFERYAGNVKCERLFCSLSCKREYFKAKKYCESANNAVRNLKSTNLQQKKAMLLVIIVVQNVIIRVWK